jgi:hypothetical protein
MFGRNSGSSQTLRQTRRVQGLFRMVLRGMLGLAASHHKEMGLGLVETVVAHDGRSRRLAIGDGNAASGGRNL